MKRFVLAILAFFLYTGIAHAEAESQALDIRLGNNSARFIYATEVFGGSFGATNLDLGLFFNEHDDYLLHVGMFIASESLENPFTISLGFRGYYADAGNNPDPSIPQTDVAALAIGGDLVFTPKNFGGFGFAVNYYLAPSVLSFMDADRFVEYGARMEFSITEQTKLLLGYRNIEVDRTDGVNVEIDSSFIFGIGLRF